MKKNKIDVVFLLKVYDEAGQLLPNVMPFRSRSGAEAAAADLVPEGRSWEIIEAAVSE